MSSVIEGKYIRIKRWDFHNGKSKSLLVEAIIIIGIILNIVDWRIPPDDKRETTNLSHANVWDRVTSVTLNKVISLGGKNFDNHGSIFSTQCPAIYRNMKLLKNALLSPKLDQVGGKKDQDTLQ